MPFAGMGAVSWPAWLCGQTFREVAAYQSHNRLRSLIAIVEVAAPCLQGSAR